MPASDRAMFETLLAQDRYDSATRLVYADWLDDHDFDDESSEQRRRATPEWIEADKWLHAYAVRLNPYDVEEYDFNDGARKLVPDGTEKAFERLIEGLRHGELFARGSDLHGLYELDDADELKRYAEVWLQRKIDWSGFEFSCSC